jgi:hypothetical protein
MRRNLKNKSEYMQEKIRKKFKGHDRVLALVYGGAVISIVRSILKGRLGTL